MSDVKVKGLAELNRFLQQLPVKMEQNVLRGALRAGAKPVQESAKANAPVATGELRDGIKITTSSRKGRITATVKLTGKHAFLGNWLEFGVAAHEIVAKSGGVLVFGDTVARKVSHPGISPRPFMRPALETRATDAVLAAANYTKNRLATKHGLDTAAVEIEAE